MGHVPESVCDLAVSEFVQFPRKDATMGVDGTFVENTKRNTSVHFVPGNHWFGALMCGHGVQSNLVCDWGYKIDTNEDLQFAEYGPNQHYDWHTDTFTLAGKDQDRKVTVVCLLNQPTEFEGGQFEIRLYNDYVAPLTKGTIIAFPSILEHRVTPVLSGVRYSATMWINGPRFR